MSSNISYLVSAQLRSAYEKSQEGLDPEIERLPLKIQEKIQNTIAQNTTESSLIQKQQLSLREVALDIYENARTSFKNRIDGAFYKLCGVRNTGNPRWSAAHIRDLDKTGKLFQSLEYVATEQKLKDWAGNSEDKLFTSQIILDFINNQDQTTLDLSSRGRFHEGRWPELLDSLPDIFDNNELKNRLIILKLEYGALSALPESICELINLEVLSLDHNWLTTLPARIGELTNLKELRLGQNQLSALTESICDLSNLNYLSLHGNILTLPLRFGELTRLESLELGNTSLRELPESFGNLSNLRRVNLSRNELETLPASIGNLRSLYVIYLNDNRLQSIPATISGLQEIQCINLCSNQLRDLPNEILQVNPECCIMLENSGLSLNVINRLSEFSNAQGYEGPSFYFSVQEENYKPPVRSLSLDHFFTSLYARAGYDEIMSFQQRYPSFYQHIQQNQKEETLRMWLSRLSYMQDSSREHEGGFSRKILSYLNLAETNENFRQDFFSIIDGATDTCGDRMALSVLHLGLKAKIETMDRNDSKSFAEFLIHGPWMIERLVDIARAKIQTLRFVDEIEVYLAYPVKLKERLGLQIDVEDMLYFACSGVTEEDLDLAASFIEQMLSGSEAKLNILIQRDDWVNFLAQKYPAAIAALRRQKDSQLESDQISYEKIHHQYSNGLLDLTRRALSR
ncbi:MAG: hypothetical protein FJZ57_03925 [Chlamydiae bacterium]|nr:hypothetical protein [Chlamydiota bacterium]